MKKILLVRRDNIGDLVCTTPLIDLILQAYPHTQLDILVNNYNADLLLNYPGINQLYIYVKSKHRVPGQSLMAIWWQRLKQIIHLRQNQYDVIFFCQRDAAVRAKRLAKWLVPKKIIYFSHTLALATSSEVALNTAMYKNTHEVKAMASMITALGHQLSQIPACRLYPQKQACENVKKWLQQQGWHQDKYLTIGVHISARKPSQRWPATHFLELIQVLATQYNTQFILFWASGDESNATHPGDDLKAQEIINAIKISTLPVFPLATPTLETLVAGLSLCNQVICSDGGAMHIAAALSKPLICLFGKSNPALWYPWAVPYQLLQHPSKQVINISVHEVAAAFLRLQQMQTF